MDWRYREAPGEGTTRTQCVAPSLRERRLQEFAAYHNAEYCIAVMNGTSALELAMVGVGLEPGDEVAFHPTKRLRSIVLLIGPA